MRTSFVGRLYRESLAPAQCFEGLSGHRYLKVDRATGQRLLAQHSARREKLGSRTAFIGLQNDVSVHELWPQELSDRLDQCVGAGARLRR
jgi:hypothetical protein